MSAPTPQRIAAAGAAAALFMLVLDLGWIGFVGAPAYALLGPLQRPTPYWPAAVLFYAMYLGAILVHAALPAASVAQAARRGAGLGFVAYATYELTNWAVIAGWPALLVPIDLGWGVFLTAATSAVARRVLG